MSDSANTNLRVPPPPPMDCRIPVSSVLHYCSDSVHWVVMLSVTISFSAALIFYIQSFCSISVFSSESALNIRWPKYWSFSISPSGAYSGLISFRMDWFDLSVQGTLRSLLQHHNSKASILGCSAFFMVQVSHLYMTTGKTIALTIQTFVSKVMSLLFNTV